MSFILISQPTSQLSVSYTHFEEEKICKESESSCLTDNWANTTNHTTQVSKKDLKISNGKCERTLREKEKNISRQSGFFFFILIRRQRESLFMIDLRSYFESPSSSVGHMTEPLRNIWNEEKISNSRISFLQARVTSEKKMQKMSRQTDRRSRRSRRNRDDTES